MARPADARPPAVAAVVLAGGAGTRAGEGLNKVYVPLGGRTAVGLSLASMARVPGVRRVVLVVRDEDRGLAGTTLRAEPPGAGPPVELVTGGASRHGSEERALDHLAPAIRAGEIDLVLLHDAARPLCPLELAARLVGTAAAHGGAVPGIDADDLAAVDAAGHLAPPAGRTVRVQTPQVFAAGPLLAAYRRAAVEGFEGTDTASCVERFGALEIRVVPGDPRNFKITYAEDLGRADRLVRGRPD